MYTMAHAAHAFRLRNVPYYHKLICLESPVVQLGQRRALPRPRHSGNALRVASCGRWPSLYYRADGQVAATGTIPHERRLELETRVVACNLQLHTPLHIAPTKRTSTAQLNSAVLPLQWSKGQSTVDSASYTTMHQRHNQHPQCQIQHLSATESRS